MSDRDYKAFIVEGEVREPQIIANVSKVFFTHGNFKVITLSAGENIYMLWNKLSEDNFETDIIEVLRESSPQIRNQLMGLSRNDFSEIFLFFDYDVHQTNTGLENGADVISQMLKSFNNETDNGKLYISYPMVEALRDFNNDTCGNIDKCFVNINKLPDYKNDSAARSINPHFKDYDFIVWKKIIDIFAMRISCLLGQCYTLSYDDYSNKACPYDIYKHEESEMLQNRVFILSAFPEFLVDYFGLKLWKNCVKHAANQMTEGKCKNQTFIDSRA